MLRRNIPKNILKNAGVFLVSASNGIIYLEAEVATHKKKEFIKKYKRWSGSEIKWNDLEKKKCVYDAGSGKWGVEYRIYFPQNDHLKSQLERYGFHVDDGSVRKSNTFRINSIELFKELVEIHRLILGQND